LAYSSEILNLSKYYNDLKAFIMLCVAIIGVNLQNCRIAELNEAKHKVKFAKLNWYSTIVKFC